MSISRFYQDEYVQSALYQSFRTIASYIDGLKPGARKIIYTADKANVKSSIKVSQLAAKVAELTQYLHGEVSLTATIVGMAQDYIGSNNINLLMPEGTFGTRFIPEAAASRYIYTKKAPLFERIFDDRDSEILTKQSFEGEEIEYRYYAPIIPLLLVNGSEGIGNGFAQKILPRDPKKLIKALIALLKEEKADLAQALAPWYRGFKGRIEQGEDNRITIYGAIKRSSQIPTQIEITELPIGYDLKYYLGILDDLAEKKIIRDYDDQSENDQFKFRVYLTREQAALSDEELIKLLKLSASGRENFTCVNEKNQIEEFRSAQEILGAYLEKRLELYELRKAYLLSDLTRQLRILTGRTLFIQLIVDGQLSVTNRKKDELLRDMEAFQIPKEEDSYEYLLKMPIHSLTAEKIEELKQQKLGKEKEVQDLEKRTPASLWIDDLMTLETKLN